MASISINPVDVKARRNDGVLSWLFAEERPVILGWDISGEVTEVGKDVTDFKSGDKVFGMVNFFGNGKAYAEYVAAPAEHLALIPAGISFQEAAATTLAASTAYQALTEIGKVKKGRSCINSCGFRRCWASCNTNSKILRCLCYRDFFC